MAPKRVVAVLACVVAVALSTSVLADEYRAGELLNLDLSKAVLSPKRIGPPAEFAPVPVEARSDAKQVVVEPKAEQQRIVHTKRVIAARVAVTPTAKPRGEARTKLAHRAGNPLDAQ